MAQIKITETVLRDAHQSLLATRMPLTDMLPVLEAMDKIGFHSVECWGGATFDSCIRFLDEDPWDRLRTIKDKMPNTKTQMLFRGQNMLGYRPYADDVLKYFVQKSAANGMDIMRIFDALNDLRNLEAAISAAKLEKGLEAQVAISYTTGETFTTEYYVDYAKRCEEIGADSICLKDMAALLTPYKTYELIKAIKETVKIPVQLHTHYTSGLASMCILKAVEAGVDAVDTALSPLALGTSHAPTESIVAALQGTEYDTGLDLKALSEIRPHFMDLRKKYIESGLIDQTMLAVDPKALLAQVPGGMLSNLLSQLKQMGKEDQLDAVLDEVPRVRQDAGMPPLVTPSSQIVGSQAVMNVLYGERYKKVTNEFKAMVKGEYGKTPIEIDPEFRKKIIGDETPIECRPADLIAPELETLKKECAQWIEQDEDVLTYAQFPKVAPKFFEKRNAAKHGVDLEHGNKESQVHPV